MPKSFECFFLRRFLSVFSGVDSRGGRRLMERVDAGRRGIRKPFPVPIFFLVNFCCCCCCCCCWVIFALRKRFSHYSAQLPLFRFLSLVFYLFFLGIFRFAALEKGGVFFFFLANARRWCGGAKSKKMKRKQKK